MHGYLLLSKVLEGEKWREYQSWKQITNSNLKSAALLHQLIWKYTIIYDSRPRGYHLAKPLQQNVRENSGMHDWTSPTERMEED
jgi:hypothetical protein